MSYPQRPQTNKKSKVRLHGIENLGLNQKRTVALAAGSLL